MWFNIYHMAIISANSHVSTHNGITSAIQNVKQNIIDAYIFWYTFGAYKSMKLNIFFRLEKAWVGTRQKLVSGYNFWFCSWENLNLLHFLWFVWHSVPCQWKVLPFGLATAPWVFTALTKPILFLCHHKGFCIVIYLDDILVLVHSKWAGKKAHLFLCSLLVRLGSHINFSKSDLHLPQTFCF